MATISKLLGGKSDIPSFRLEWAIATAWNETRKITEVKPVIEFLKNKKLSGKAVDISTKMYPVSPEWGVYHNKKSKSKTDIIIGDKRISVKSTTQSQLMKYGKLESKALFMTVFENLKIKKLNMINEILSKLEEFINTSIIDASVSERQNDPVVIKGNKVHAEMNELLLKFFNENPMFKYGLVNEAITGQLKFGKDSIATATHILDIKDKNNIKFNIIDKNVIDKILPKVKVDVSFSSTSKKKGEYKFYSTVRLIVQELSKKNEGIISSIGSYIKNLLTNLKKYFVEKIDNIFSFLEIEPVLTITYKE